MNVALDKKTNLVWIDLEMTGLDIDDHRIVQIATIVTDKNLRVVAEGPEITINQPDTVLAQMSPGARDLHQKSGLIDAIVASEITEQDAEKETLDFVRSYVPEGISPLCGNSVYMDRMFIIKYMRDLDSYLHYRLIDVSSVKELYKRWYPKLPLYKKDKVHTALEDIRMSINELKFYKDKVFTTALESH